MIFERKNYSPFTRSGASAAADRIQFQMTLHEEDEENVDEKDQVGIRKPKLSDNTGCPICSVTGLG